MSTLSLLRLIHLLYLSRPKSDRSIFRAIRRRALRQGGLCIPAPRPVDPTAQSKEISAPHKRSAQSPASKPAAAPAIVRILELGVGSALRAQRLINLVETYHPEVQVSYTGVDVFEARCDGGPGTTLKEAYRQLRAHGAKVKLHPGEPIEALCRLANHLGQNDLVVISASHAKGLPPHAWHYLPRVVHSRSMVFIEKQTNDGQTATRMVSMTELLRRADKATVTRKAA